ncbi:hypothetical protein CU098_006809 [Rhizopus stolonifer]|uniref:Major facilitator superfamily (MFS) profile domain-containing protein n=1 Tax=Rhizopus stolonifer TaxID=4846 RepID=A0A367KI57_RHIST|nr:hypothetical protein CU098_006809 [Rhizopus stolonifer]
MTNTKEDISSDSLTESIKETLDPIPYSVFPKRQKITIVAIASMSAFFSPFSSNIYYPSIKILQQEMQVSSSMINLTITLYMVFQGISPSFWGTVADSVGRRPVFLATFLIYIAACVGLASANNFATLVTLRMLQSFGSSSAIAVGAGTIGDISTPSERGGNMGILSMGGIVTYELGWRWIFWLLVIMASTVWLLQLFFLPETLRKLVGNGSVCANPTPYQYWKNKKLDKQLEPVIEKDPNEPKLIYRMFQSFIYFKEKDVLVVLLYSSLEFACLQCILSSLTPLFVDAYQIDEFKVGLTFLAPGFGSLLGSYGSGKLMNWRFKKIADSLHMDKNKRERHNLDPEFPIEKARMGNVWIYGILFNIGMIAYGWTLHYRVNLAVPIILNFVTSCTSAATFNVTNTLLVDLFPKNSSTIVATNNLARCLISAVAILVVQPGVGKIGTGWTFTAISLALLASRAFLFVELAYGPRWRHKRNGVQ